MQKETHETQNQKYASFVAFLWNAYAILKAYRFQIFFGVMWMGALAIPGIGQPFLTTIFSFMLAHYVITILLPLLLPFGLFLISRLAAECWMYTEQNSLWRNIFEFIKNKSAIFAKGYFFWVSPYLLVIAFFAIPFIPGVGEFFQTVLVPSLSFFYAYQNFLLMSGVAFVLILAGYLLQEGLSRWTSKDSGFLRNLMVGLGVGLVEVGFPLLLLSVLVFAFQSNPLLVTLSIVFVTGSVLLKYIGELLQGIGTYVIAPLGAKLNQVIDWAVKGLGIYENSRGIYAIFLALFDTLWLVGGLMNYWTTSMLPDPKQDPMLAYSKTSIEALTKREQWTEKNMSYNDFHLWDESYTLPAFFNQHPRLKSAPEFNVNSSAPTLEPFPTVVLQGCPNA